ncbi:DUF92 domain-containing protein [Bacillus sp. FJAT-29790]|uniref:DUF92 domain-containing protein n=1 Tax=Bacillus sp. FJAT-29790 TaxID=1895002 RepID=UPI001C215AAC|nr:DUF92 domain-containing protein [Bacillus sp. FJAT-29790]MBU8879385.1 DUF92 domain-containing protein [Bacillus sp. FJAT-29790]
MSDPIFIYLFIAVTAISGYYFRLLTKSGSIAAFLIGLAVSAAFGMNGLLLLGFFFASSSFLSKYKSKVKIKIEERHEKGSRRDWQQVAANGGTAAIAGLLYLAFPHPIWFIGFAISIASSNSDTWASEIGSLSKRPPVFLRSFKRIETGTSGAVSFLGTFAAIGGALTIAALSSYLFHLTSNEFLVIFIFGFAGNVFDTLLGAFVQAVYQCKVCHMEVESLNHCGVKTQLTKGVSFINNDFVNFFSGFLAAILGTLSIVMFR